MIRRLGLIVLLFVTSARGELLEVLSGTIVYLLHQEPNQQGMAGTGFLVVDDNGIRFLVTAQHVAVGLKSHFTATIRGENDTPITIKSEDLVGAQSVQWVTHDKEDVAVVTLHPAPSFNPILRRHFLQTKLISAGTKAPSRERILTALGFPLSIGIEGHFSPISKESKPASGLLTLPRFDTHSPAVFFLLEINLQPFCSGEVPFISGTSHPVRRYDQPTSFSDQETGR